MVGQERLKSLLSKYDLETLPQSLLFVGKKGCGKHLCVQELAERLSIPIIDISSNLTFEFLQDIQVENVNPCLYLIDTTSITERAQNVILKFLEEPTKNVYIVLLSEDKESLLPTIRNRCVTMEWEPYSKDELKQFIVDKTYENELLEVCETPGQITSINAGILQSLYKLCDTIVEKIDAAPYHNTLTIAGKINYKEDYDKYDYHIFINVLRKRILRHYERTGRDIDLEIYKIVHKYAIMGRDSRMNREMIIKNMLTEMWERVHI